MDSVCGWEDYGYEPEDINHVAYLMSIGYKKAKKEADKMEELMNL